MKKDFEKKTVLIVEDDILSLKFLNLLLKKNGFFVINAENGDKAIDLLNNNKIDIVILDLQIPGLGGFEVIKSFKKNNRKIPIIVQSAGEVEQFKEKCINMGCDDYLPKPINTEELIMKINKLI